MQKINPADLVPLDIFENREPIKIDLVYAQADHPRNIFKEAVYKNDSRLWAHKDLATITILAARMLQKKHGWILEIQDCLRNAKNKNCAGQPGMVRGRISIAI